MVSVKIKLMQYYSCRVKHIKMIGKKMMIFTVRDEHSTLILFFGVFALRCALPFCDCCINNMIKNIQPKTCSNHVKSSPLKRELK